VRTQIIHSGVARPIAPIAESGDRAAATCALHVGLIATVRDGNQNAASASRRVTAIP
jgi:hypothetical protein